MYKRTLLLAAFFAVGSLGAIANPVNSVEGTCERVTAVEYSATGVVKAVCFNEGGVCAEGAYGGGKEVWWYYNSNDFGGFDGNKTVTKQVYLRKTASPLDSLQTAKAVTRQNNPLVNGDSCMVIKGSAMLWPSDPGAVWRGAGIPVSFEKMICRPALGETVNGCSSLMWMGWQLLR